MRDPTHPAHAEDDVDRLFARLDREPVPEHLTARVLASTVRRTEAARAVLAWPWVLAGLAALGLLLVTGYQLGASLAMSDGLELVTALVQDFGLFATAPGEVVAALGEAIPWTLVVLAGLSAGLLILAVGKVVSRTSSSMRPAPSA
jgi:hypothetical protein